MRHVGTHAAVPNSVQGRMTLSKPRIRLAWVDARLQSNELRPDKCWTQKQ